MDLVARHLEHSLEQALASFRVVVLHGARQCGKSTLARAMVVGRGATASPTAGQLEHVRWLRDKLDVATPGTFRAGVHLYTGPQAAAVGDRLHLLPISTLWSVATD